MKQTEVLILTLIPETLKSILPFWSLYWINIEASLSLLDFPHFDFSFILKSPTDIKVLLICIYITQTEIKQYLKIIISMYRELISFANAMFANYIIFIWKHLLSHRQSSLYFKCVITAVLVPLVRDLLKRGSQVRHLGRFDYLDRASIAK